MRRFGDSSNRYFDCALRDSLNTIKEAHVQLYLLTGTARTAAALASQIELCDVLLVGISGIQASLARDLENTRLVPQSSGHVHLNA
jgi:hypothetical protein